MMKFTFWFSSHKISNAEFFFKDIKFSGKIEGKMKEDTKNLALKYIQQ
jgi:hypothetical protein